MLPSLLRRKLLYLSLSGQSWQPRNPPGDVQLCSRLGLFNPCDIIERSSLNDNNPAKRFGIPKFRYVAPTIAAERISQRHATVLGGRICFGRARSDLEFVLWNQDVGGECTPADMAACQAVANGLRRSATKLVLIPERPTFMTGSPEYSYLS